jgi:phosphocarrier protein
MPGSIPRDATTDTIRLRIDRREGLHARPAALFVQTARKFEADITVIAKGRTANAKSILSLLTLGLGPEEEITIRATGRDALDALRAIKALIETDFEETS